MKTEIYKKDGSIEAHVTIGKYSAVIEIWHRDDYAAEEAYLNGRDTYYFNNVKTKDIPKTIKDQFDAFSEELWNSYESPNFPTR